MAAGLVVVVAAFVLGRVWVAAFGGLGGVLGAASGFAAAWYAARALTATTRRALELERGISGLSVFQTSDGGRAIIERIQREHPLLVRTSLGEGGSAPPPANGVRVTTSRK
jgi:hypothetical protein